jgi:glycosyltransferase A (GT-A) superfamily protein (DUF2064 family)
LSRRNDVSHVLVMAKSPVAGRVKTRLCPPCTPQEAADIAEAALADTLDAVAGCGASRRIVALAGDPGPWLPTGFAVIPQRGAGLATRLANAWADAGGPGIQIGMDTPQVTAGDLDHLLALVAPGHSVLGRACDGGWWVIGLPLMDQHIDHAAVFTGIPMSTPVTGDRQERRLRALGLTVRPGPVRRDIDTAEDLAAVAAEAPGTRTARLAAALGFDRPVTAEVA